jgi:hypothetical protein
MISVNTDDLSFVSFVKVVDEVLDRIFGFFDEEHFGEFMEHRSKLIGFDVFLCEDFLLHCLLFVHEIDE